MKIINSDIFNIKIPQPEPRSGDLLLAVPFMDDGCFSHAVVCLIEHSLESGTMGLVTNRLSGYTLNELVEDIPDSEDIPVFIGGPVHNDRLYYLHTLGNLIPDSVEVVPGLYVGGDFDAVKRYISEGNMLEGRIRFFVGWAVAKIKSVDDVMTGVENGAWRLQVANLGEKYRIWLNCPPNALLN